MASGRALVIGLAETGVAVARALLRDGYDVVVFLALTGEMPPVDAQSSSL